MIITLYTTRAVLANLGVEDYGVYNVVCGFVSMFSFLNTSMANGTQRFYNYEIGKNGEKNVGKIFTHAMLIQLGIVILILLVVEAFGIWYINNKMVIPEGRASAAFWIFQFAMLQLFLVMITVPYNAAVMAYEKMHYFAFISILDAILKLIIVLLLPYAPFDTLVYYGLLMTMISFANLLLYYLYCSIKLKKIKFQKKLEKEQFISMLSFSGWNIFGTVAHMMQNHGVNLILNAFWGTIVNAANGVAHQVNTAVTSLTAGFITAIRPQMIKSYACGDIEYLKKMYYSISKITFFLVMIIAVPLIGEIETILDVWLGNGKYPDMTALFCQLSMVMTLCNSYATPTSIIAHATGKMKTFQITVSAVILLVIPLSYIFLKLGFESYVVIIVSTFVNIAAQFTRLFVIKRQVGFSVYHYIIKVFIPTWFVLIISIIIALTLNSMTPNSFIWSIFRIIINIIASIILIYLIGLNQSERNLALSFIKNK